MKTNFDEIETSVTKSIPYLASFDARCFTKSLAIGGSTATTTANLGNSCAQKYKKYLAREHTRLFL